MGLLTLLLIIAGIAILIIGLFNRSDSAVVIVTTGITMFACGIAMIPLLIYESDTIPTALDVYRGKTTLEITYRDSIPVDSVVVFKK